MCLPALGFEIRWVLQQIYKSIPAGSLSPQRYQTRSSGFGWRLLVQEQHSEIQSPNQTAPWTPYSRNEATKSFYIKQYENGLNPESRLHTPVEFDRLSERSRPELTTLVWISDRPLTLKIISLWMLKRQSLPTVLPRTLFTQTIKFHRGITNKVHH